MKNEDKSIGDLMGEMKGIAEDILASKPIPGIRSPGIRSIADGWFQDQELMVKMLMRYTDLMDIEKVGFKAANRVMETTYPDGWKAHKIHTWEFYDNMGEDG
jgi:hypothetical protein